MKKEVNNTGIDFEELNSDELIEYISFKDEYKEAAALAFEIFCSRFESKIFRKSEIYCNKFNFSEAVAAYIVNCTFARVWKYHSFTKGKAKRQNVDDAIEIWLCKILYNEVVKYNDKRSCAEKDEEDLPIIENFDHLVDYFMKDDEEEEAVERKRDLKKQLDYIERALAQLSLKHQIIYLTYKAYGEGYIPRKVGKALRERLNLTQNSIRVYKMEAEKHIKTYLEYLNGNK
ncbi:RNA polymerase sigma factor [Chryseobacterium flavum]|uniref:RNA polymerase sigma factor n=1 Tax=Chryseobacterium flavum TaxID=415851 RepID=UPI0028A5C71A|nr:RNA polymerase subunit sigma [Chryseobacterium flavum]